MYKKRAERLFFFACRQSIIDGNLAFLIAPIAIGGLADCLLPVAKCFLAYCGDFLIPDS